MFDRGCARCGPSVPALAAIDSEPLCDACFDAELAHRREQVDRIIMVLEERFIVEDDGVTTSDLRKLGFTVDEIRSPLLCGGDE